MGMNVNRKLQKLSPLIKFAENLPNASSLLKHMFTRILALECSKFGICHLYYHFVFQLYYCTYINVILCIFINSYSAAFSSDQGHCKGYPVYARKLEFGMLLSRPKPSTARIAPGSCPGVVLGQNV